MAKKKISIDTSVRKNIPLLLRSRMISCPEITLQAAKDEHGVFQMYSYKQVYQKVVEMACALKKIGIQRGDKIALISDNRREWLVADMALLSLGAADVPRGCDSMGTEIRFIISFVECKIGFFETGWQLSKVLEKREEIPTLKTAILFEKATEEVLQTAKNAGITVIAYTELEKMGETASEAERAVIEHEMDITEADEVATIIFTSGTTGIPKGVMLTHDNFLAQVEVARSVLTTTEDGELWFSVLPVWHSFERAFQYFIIGLNSGLVYSKMAPNVMLADMAAVRPHGMIGVPRLWESMAQSIWKNARKEGGLNYLLFRFFVAVGKKYYWAKTHVKGLLVQVHRRCRFLDALVGIVPYILLTPLYALGNIVVYKKVREKFGGRIGCALSGGGTLQYDTDMFYHAIGFNLLEGYGITEAAPILSIRWPSKARSGCVGQVYPSAEIKIVAEEHGKIISSEPLPPGKRGLVLARGRQIMKGYYKRPDLTAQVIDEDGWLNTGDLGMLTYDNEIKITGRAKDTIVLLGGENIEPQVLEATLRGSPYIEMAVILGQDKKYLGALIVPIKDALVAYAQEHGISTESYEDLLENHHIMDLIRNEIDSKICDSAGFRICERIYRFALLKESFTVGKELSGKQEMMRHKIVDIYKDEIASLFD